MSLEPSEVFFITVLVMSVVLAPGTKVEESFNLQATHDFLFIAPWNISQFDHHDCPGVVPRTFVGPLVNALIASPLSLLWRIFYDGKIVHLMFARLSLGFTFTVVFLRLADTIRIKFGQETAMFFRVICASQFHLMFYASRTLPNTYALIIVLMVIRRLLDEKLESAVSWATLCVFLFSFTYFEQCFRNALRQRDGKRFETIVLFGPLFLFPICEGRLKLFGYRGALVTGIRTVLQVFAFTIPFDSYMWGRVLWPEGGVIHFNIIENKSHEYGVSPFGWYFLIGLPKALLISFLFVPIGCFIERRVRPYAYPAFLFVLLISFLPHKETRFIVYSFPLFNLAAAVVCARAYVNSRRCTKFSLQNIYNFMCTSHILVNLLASSVLLFVSSANYPGFVASNDLQYRYRMDANKPVSVYIDNAVAQTGHSRFTEMYPSWTYNKTENLTPEDVKNFDFLLLGTYGTDLIEKVERNYSKYHHVVNYITAFHTVRLRIIDYLPQPEIEYAKKAVVMVKNGYA